MSYGWNATSCQILNPGIDHWFSSTNKAVVGYTRRNGLLAVAGAPVCAPELLADACAEFEAYAHGIGCRVCYVCAEDRLRNLLAASPPHAEVVLGAQPVWDPRTWTGLVQKQASLRAQLNRSRNKAVVVEPAVPEQAATNPDLRKVLREWLEARRLPPLHFLVEPDVLDGVVSGRIVLVAKHNGRAVAFLVASPVVARNGYLVELLARSHSAPNGTSELLIDAAMQCFAREDCHYATLGLVALTHVVDQEMRRNPLWLRVIMQFARAHANRFYNFRGLEWFRIKMIPGTWEPLYAISNEKSFSVQTLYNIGGAFAGISPCLAVAIGIARAIGRELM
jgi:phosphatidylglycerol lysyltransferase